MSSAANNQVFQTLSSRFRYIRRQKNNGQIEEWEKEANARAAKIYQELGLKLPSWAKTIPEFALQQEVLGWLITVRSGYGHFADYHQRFGHDKPDLLCQCDKKRAQLHPFLCPMARPHRGKLFYNKLERQLLPNEVLGTPEKVKVFAVWGPATKLFGRNNNRGL